MRLFFGILGAGREVAAELVACNLWKRDAHEVHARLRGVPARA